MSLSIEEKKSIIAYRVQKADSVFGEMRLVSRLQNMRHAGDYDDMFDWAEENVRPLLNRTELLIQKIKNLLSLVG